MKDMTSVNILVFNYTNKHLTIHKGEYIGHLEPAVLDSTDQRDIHQANSVTLKKMMSETVTPDTFNPPQHELSAPYKIVLNCYYKNMSHNSPKMRLQ